MALDASRLSADLRSRLLANPNAHAVNNAQLTALCDEIAAALVAEITGHAVVPALGLIAPPGTAGGPVTGSAVIT